MGCLPQPWLNDQLWTCIHSHFSIPSEELKFRLLRDSELSPVNYKHALKLKSFAKTSGSKGLQLYVPLNTPVTYEKTKAFARALAELLETQSPQRVVSKMQKSLRQGKVFVDWSQNDDHKTTVNVYSLRAKEHPTVSTPVSWDEVETALKKKNTSLLLFEADAVLKRVQTLGDLFAPVLLLKQKLPSLDTLRL